jgi:hypothetical protein
LTRFGDFRMLRRHPPSVNLFDSGLHAKANPRIAYD